MSFPGNTSRQSSVYIGDLMTELSTTAAVRAEPSKGLLARVIGVFVSPRATYADIAARPRWFGVLAFSTLIVAGGFFILLSTEVGQQAVIDQQVPFMESF